MNQEAGIEFVEIVEPAVPTGMEWQPRVGSELQRFLNDPTKGDDQRKRLLEESTRLLGRCVPSTASVSATSKRAGLVLGYVQSGKTSSFEAVAALAHDNGYKLVIVIAGTSAILQDQTYDRIVQDFGLNAPDAFARWHLARNPNWSTDAGNHLKNILEQHADSPVWDLGIPLVVVMKQHVHLGNLIELLEHTSGLDRIPCLIIDDEAHMHSPDVGKDGQKSATYAQIRSLRDQLPVHTLLQYTATPQAPLLAEITDELSPEFVQLLEPGPGYTGGEYFFSEHRDTFVHSIPANETYALDESEFANQGPPSTLVQAFLTYLLICAAERHWEEQAGERRVPGHRSMLVHPKATKAIHNLWDDAIKAMVARISGLLDEREEDITRVEFIEEELVPAWESLLVTEPSLPSILELVPRIKQVLQLLRFALINSSSFRTPPEWPQSRYWILTGGNLLGVGYTVEGLVVTHMMRPPGDRLMDSIQQRARFFGYKSTYATRCRAWLQSELEDAFVDYVRHENGLRVSLKEIDRQNMPLREWKRVFLMDPRFKPTRKAAQRIVLANFDPEKSAGWCLQRHFDPENLPLIDSNRGVVDEFLGGLRFSPAPEISGNTLATQHAIAGCSYSDLLGLLASLRFENTDSDKFTALGLLLGTHRDNDTPEPQCSVVRVGAGLGVECRERTIEGRVVTLHQGRNPGRANPYAGDKEARARSGITLQVHSVNVLGPNNDLIGQQIYFIAVYIPPELWGGIAVEV